VNNGLELRERKVEDFPIAGGATGSLTERSQNSEKQDLVFVILLTILTDNIFSYRLAVYFTTNWRRINALREIAQN